MTLQQHSQPDPIRLPDNGGAHTGQATQIEQSRAIAQVQAAVVMARQFPRSQQRAIDQMLDACGRMELADRAFFKFPRAGQTVTGASVYLARELARIWGNIDYGLNELRRDDLAGQSELQAYAWDLETNARSARVFIIEHARDTKQGRKQLTELRDISDNNNNFGARAVREMIYAVLPQWFTDMAQQKCRDTLNNGGGKPLPLRIKEAVDVYAKAHVTKAQLEEKVGAPVDDWTHGDVTDLQILFKSLTAREITREEAFPEKSVTGEELTAQAKAPRNAALKQPPKSPSSPVQPWTPEPADDQLPADPWAKEATA